jgi:ABC-2 type transport system ATP-binding protein
MLEVHELTKTFGDHVAVDHVSFTARPGQVTGFLGPNGAGKSTTMRMILGLDRPTSGHALVNGRPYVESPAPLAEIGALLEAKAVDKGRSARAHLLALAATVGIGASRVDEVIELVGLTDVARRRAGGFSLGMGQRLGLAAALLADPAVVMLDEPVNGLDPDGILWIRQLLRHLAGEGRTVFLSSHLMNELELTADHLVVIGRGRILADTTMSEFLAAASRTRVRVVSPQARELRDALTARGATVSSSQEQTLDVDGLDSAAIGDVAASLALTLHELSPVHASLEEAYLELTRDAVEYRGADDARHLDRKAA